MRRSKTPATAWPAVADLMTILAVIGLSAAAVVSTERNMEIEDLNDKLVERDAKIAELENRIREFQELRDNEIGFTPCWRGATEDKRYFFTYDVTFGNGTYAVSKHVDFNAGVNADTPGGLLAVLDNLPTVGIDESAFLAFGRSVSRATMSVYTAGCRLAVTINQQVTGDVISTITRAGFFPVYRE